MVKMILIITMGWMLTMEYLKVFTLDATLIPDFWQTAFDDITLNLGPFEQQYS